VRDAGRRRTQPPEEMQRRYRKRAEGEEAALGKNSGERPGGSARHGETSLMRELQAQNCCVPTASEPGSRIARRRAAEE